MPKRIKDAMSRSSHKPKKREIEKAKDVVKKAIKEGFISFSLAEGKVFLTKSGVVYLKEKYGQVFGTPVVRALSALNEALRMTPPLFRLSESSSEEDFDSLFEAIDFGEDVPEGVAMDEDGDFRYPDKVRWTKSYRVRSKPASNEGDKTCPPIKQSVSKTDFKNGCAYKRDELDPNSCVKVCDV